jgi:quercetin dioxygenase-like cupin family protein
MSAGHVGAGEVINLEKLDGRPEDATLALVKTEHMEVIRMVLPRGKDIMEHSVDGEISVQCIKGTVLFQMENNASELTEGDWLYLEGKQKHALYAKSDAVLLITILFTKDG